MLASLGGLGFVRVFVTWWVSIHYLFFWRCIVSMDRPQLMKLPWRMLCCCPRESDASVWCACHFVSDEEQSKPFTRVRIACTISWSSWFQPSIHAKRLFSSTVTAQCLTTHVGRIHLPWRFPPNGALRAFMAFSLVLLFICRTYRIFAQPVIVSSKRNHYDIELFMLL